MQRNKERRTQSVHSDVAEEAAEEVDGIVVMSRRMEMTRTRTRSGCPDGDRQGCTDRQARPPLDAGHPPLSLRNTQQPI